MVRILFKDLKIDNVANASGVFTGDNLQVKWKSFISLNEGYGEVNGDKNKTLQSKNIILQPRPAKKDQPL